MLVSKTKLKLAFAECMKEAVVFSHFFGIYDNKKKILNRFLTGNLTIDMIENDLNITKATTDYVESVKAAIQKLYTLNKAFYILEEEYLMARIETFADMEKVLEDIERIFIAA